jgi:hypothetical protein
LYTTTGMVGKSAAALAKRACARREIKKAPRKDDGGLSIVFLWSPVR